MNILIENNKELEKKFNKKEIMGALREVKKLPLIFLIISNLFPLFGAIFFNWDISYIIILYWSENIIIGFYNVLKMLVVKNKEVKLVVNDKNTLLKNGNKFLIPFFCIHFGIFTFAHGVFVFSLWGEFFNFDTFIKSFFVLFLSHGVSYLINFILSGENKTINIGKLFIAPYKRVFILHLLIMSSGFLLLGLNDNQNNILPLVFLVFLKIAIDLVLHVKEHLKVKKE